jgi:hypothetical protein
MPLDIEMDDSDLLVNDRVTELDPAIVASISPAPERLAVDCILPIPCRMAGFAASAVGIHSICLRVELTGSLINIVAR